jgi:hypothetical protein
LDPKQQLSNGAAALDEARLAANIAKLAELLHKRAISQFRFPQSQKERLRPITPRLCFPSIFLRLDGIGKMITAAEYRAWAEESLKWASEARTANERDAYIKVAETWLQCALRSERRSKESMPATEHDWVLPPFQEWRRKGTPLK